MPIVRKPARHSFGFDASLLEHLSGIYGLGSLAGFRPILLDGDYCTLIDVRSATSRKMVIEDEHGRHLFLKQIPWYCDTATLALAVAWQDQLRAAGVPVPELLRTPAGHAWVSLGDAIFTLSVYTSGRRYSATPGERAATAQLLARVHATPVTLPNAPADNPFTAAAQHIDLARQGRPNDDVQAALDRMCADLARWRWHADHAGWPALAGQAAHGDVNPWNLLFDADTVVALLDFDNAHRGPALRDLAEALLTFCSVRYRGDSTTFAAEPPAPLAADTATEILTAYTTSRPLTPVERACLPEVTGAVAVELACLGLIRGDYTTTLAPVLADWTAATRAAAGQLFAHVPDYAAPEGRP